MVAETEQADLDAFVTFDEELIEHLAPHTSLLLGMPFDVLDEVRPNGDRLLAWTQ